jgi:Protein of unknown function (DUF1549)/Protein of unknown function (DUF1553)
MRIRTAAVSKTFKPLCHRIGFDWKEGGSGMIGLGISNRSIRRRLLRTYAERVTFAVSIAIILVASAFARSFEPFRQDQAEKTPQPAKDTGKLETDSGKSTPREAHDSTKTKNANAKQAAARKNQATSSRPNDEQAKIPLPKRPSRSVSAPTLTTAELDRLVTQFLTKNSPKVEPATLTTDVEYVRRIYFDTIGRPPTPQQVQSFLQDHSKDKRARLVDTLLGSPEYARNWAKYWRDVIMFHSTSENPNQVRFDALEDWLAKRLQANTPWDEIVSGMMTATGRNDENGAVAFPLAYEAQPVEMAGEVSRIFMGVQIQCAQCHDHKTDSWKQRQFHEFAAFFAGVRRRQVEKPAPGQPAVFAVEPQGQRRYSFPDKDNPKKQIPVGPRFFLSSSKSQPEPVLPEAVGVPERRALAASYVTGQDNPWFAKAYINRIWYALLGEAFYEPIDDIGPERTAKAVEVLEPLAEQWQKGGYDIRWLFRTILNTEVYQRRIRSTANEAGKTLFASSCPSRMRADQVFDALAQALALPLDADGDLKQPAKPNATNPAQGKNAKQAQTSSSLGDPKRAQGEVVTKGAAKKNAAAIGLASQLGKKPGAMLRTGGPRLLVDRLFGVDPSVANEDVVGTIPQALFLMNGPLVNDRTKAKPGTVLGEILSSAPNDRAALGMLYLRILSRQPTNHEVEICGRYLASVGDRVEAFEDIYWSLINTTEFLTRR